MPKTLTALPITALPFAAVLAPALASPAEASNDDVLVRKAAEGDNAEAALRLSQMYRAGSGTNADPAQAAQ